MRELTLEQRIARLERAIKNEARELTQDMADELRMHLEDELRNLGVNVTSRTVKCIAQPYNQIDIVYKNRKYTDMKFYLDIERNTMISREVGGRLNDRVATSPRLEVHARAIAQFIKNSFDNRLY